MSRQRADLALVTRGFFPSRAKAQEAIAAGLVRIDGKIVSKASEMIDPEVQIEATAAYPWVSRGGVKLAAALDAFGYDPSGQLCLDIGASTGGFTDVLLARGAAQVYAVDVGRGQLNPKFYGDPRVIVMETTDARALTLAVFSAPPRFITCDVSFISLRLVLPPVLALAAPGATLVALIKPQFEVGPDFVVKGIVKDEAKRQSACDEIEAVLSTAGWMVNRPIPSPIEGAEGNREYLIGARNLPR
jgi:23S rRNA (cytidine1920-2'-O)/16S rRNA (cytidine1409-2'-O)-methyltransferase